VRITSEPIMGRHGVIQANISVYDSKTNKWWPKRTKPAHTFFPNHWSERQTRQEIEHAFNNAKFEVDSDLFWTGRSTEGVKIAGRFRVEPDGTLRWTSAYPVIELQPVS
jgi:filamentous hemagglutinin